MSGLQNRLNKSCRRCVLAPGTQLAPGAERGDCFMFLTLFHVLNLAAIHCSLGYSWVVHITLVGLTFGKSPLYYFLKNGSSPLAENDAGKCLNSTMGRFQNVWISRFQF